MAFINRIIEKTTQKAGQLGHKSPASAQSPRPHGDISYPLQDPPAFSTPHSDDMHVGGYTAPPSAYNSDPGTPVSPTDIQAMHTLVPGSERGTAPTATAGISYPYATAKTMSHPVHANLLPTPSPHPISGPGSAFAGPTSMPVGAHSMVDAGTIARPPPMATSPAAGFRPVVDMFPASSSQAGSAVHAGMELGYSNNPPRHHPYSTPSTTAMSGYTTPIPAAGMHTPPYPPAHPLTHPSHIQTNSGTPKVTATAYHSPPSSDTGNSELRPSEIQGQQIPRDPHGNALPPQARQDEANRSHVGLTDFTIHRTLGTGSFGRVRLVQYKRSKQFFAMKVLKKTEVVRAKQVEHVNNERDILGVCSSPFLVSLLGSFQDNVNLYMVMEYVVGGELFTYLRKYQRFPPQVAKFYSGEVILAFEYLHSFDIIYRDLKPENVLIDQRGHIKLTDFGFAKYVPDITWTLCGTPDYLAPEIIQSKGYGKAVDWYSLGVLIFEMLAGYPPFYDEDHFKLYEKILAGRINWPSYFDPLAKDLVKRLLTADLSKRFGNLKGGSRDIKSHKWLMEIDWTKLLNRQIPAPLIPHVSHTGDASNFDVYPEPAEVYGNYSADDPYRVKFPHF
ncbi:cAMP-dependent protein kinase catalytic subunit [Dimargaris verticillata]|uniref:cAMP-dependent protein kinase n=1 Tax=Dimargaris verticillata TaxID=2761393 RepID=A0A9W8E7Y9_9FUNG|nr:cAMP-dependent protein kinase catalytic subunit [Dimargaris verticillata]